MTKLDPQERALLAAFEQGKLQSVATKEDLKRYIAAARATPTDSKELNIDLPAEDWHALQAHAERKGMPYQSLVASILHQYLTGRLIEPTASAAANAHSAPAEKASQGG